MTTWAPCRCGQPMRDGTCCCDYCVGAYDHQPEAPDHRAALTGCVGVHSDKRGFGSRWCCDGWCVCWSPVPGDVVRTCTADAAVLAGGDR